MTASYLKRVLVMLLIAMPFTAILLATVETLAGNRSSSRFGDNLAGAVGLVYVWGAVTATLLSIVHSALVATETVRSTTSSIILSTILGAMVGAATPTLFTGFMHPPAIALGAITGVVYGLLVAFMFQRAKAR